MNDWTFDAECRGVPLEIFFPPDGSKASTRRRAEDFARLYCYACPVLNQCRTEAMDRERGLSWRHRFGVFGGLNPKEREQLDKKAVAA